MAKEEDLNTTERAQNNIQNPCRSGAGGLKLTLERNQREIIVEAEKGRIRPQYWRTQEKAGPKKNVQTSWEEK